MKGSGQTLAYALVLAMVLTCIPVQVSAMTSPSHDDISQDPQLSGKESERTIINDGISTTYRSLTDVDVQVLRSEIGVRQSDFDYNLIVDGHGTGLAPLSEMEWSDLKEGSYAMVTMDGEIGVPATFDLSTSSSFPTVGDQLSQGSCAAWAMTYYCYGYIESVDQGWTQAKSGLTSQLLSPAFTYNRVSDYDHGSSMSGNAYVIRDWGVPTLSTMPYVASDYLSWGSDVAQREAPAHRAINVMYIIDKTVSSIKNVVQSGKPVTFAIDALQYNTAFADNSVSKIISAIDYDGSTNLNHAQTIVGWDDGITEDGDVGAFRVVNSWGSGFGESGYYWITYNALAEMTAKYTPTYIDDQVKYVPKIGAVLHFDNLPGRDTVLSFNLIDKVTGTILKTKTLYYYTSYSYGAVPKMPAYLYLDLTEFAESYLASSNNCIFAVKFTGGTSVGNMTSFRVEWYEGGYTPGRPTHVSDQAAGLPASTSGSISLSFTKYSTLTMASALDCSALPFSTSGIVTWTPIVHNYQKGGSAMQSGDVADLHSSTMSTVVSGPSTLSFFWKVSSESNNDVLKYSVDSVVKASISGSTAWAPVSVTVEAGLHYLNWTYSKSSSISRAGDCGYVDNVTISTSGLETIPPVTNYALTGTLGLAGWYTTSISVTLSSTDIGSGVSATYYRLNGGTWIRYTGSFTVTTEGTTALDYYSRDVIGNIEVFKSATLKKDSVSPSTIATISGYTVTLSASDSSSGVNHTYYNIDSTGWALYSVPFNAGTIGIQHIIDYYSIDRAGKTETTKRVTVGTNDTVAPVTVASKSGSLGNNSWYTSAVTVYLNATDSGGSGLSTTYHKIDGAAGFTAYSSPLAISTDGSHTVQYYSTDARGNIESIKTITFKIDRSAPTTSNSLSGYTVTLSASDVTSGIQSIYYSIDSAGWTQYSTAFTVGVAGHQYVVQYYSRDLAGNKETTKVLLVGTNDSTPPTSIVSLTGTLGGNNWYRSSVTVTLSATDLGGSGVQNIYYRWQGATKWTLYANSFTTATEGSRTLEIYAIDNVGNIETVHTKLVKIDKTVPSSTAQVSGSIVTLGATDTSSGVSYIRYSIDGSDWATYSSSFNVGILWSQHTVQYWAADIAGNQESIKTLYVGQNDHAAPTTILAITGTSGINGWYTSSLSVTMTATDDLSGVNKTWFKVDSGPWTRYSSAISIGTDGHHTISFNSTDIAGNIETTHIVALNIDRVAPTGSHQINNDTMLLQGADATSGVRSITYHMDGGEINTYSGLIILPNPTLSHTVVYRITDNAGNIGAEYTVEIPAQSSNDFYIPSPPRDLQVELNIALATLIWQVPMDTGNATLLGYKIFRANGSEDFQLIGSSNTNRFNDSSMVLGITYSYHVLAYNSIGESDSSNQVQLTYVTKPSAPATLNVRSSEGKAQLDWTLPSSNGGLPILSYISMRSTTSGGSEVQVQLTSTTLGYTDPDVVAGQTYYYRIYAINSLGMSDGGPERSVTIPYIMNPPTDLNASLEGKNITLTWQMPSGSSPSAYQIFRSIVGSAPSMVGTVIQSSYMDNDLLSATSYQYSVCGIYGSQEGPRSWFNITIPADVPKLLEQPNDVRVSIQADQALVTWTFSGIGITEPVSFRVYRSLNINMDGAVLLATVDTNQYLDTTIQPGTDYYYQISAVIGAEESTPSDPVMVQVLSLTDRVPGIPTNLTAQVTATYVRLTWEAPTDPGTGTLQGYRLYRSLDNGAIGLLAEINGLYFIDDSFIPGIEFRYWVAASGSVGESERCGPLLLLSQTGGEGDPTVPTALTVSVFNNHFSLNWIAPEGNIIGYNIYSGNTTDDMKLVITIPSSMTKYVDGSNAPSKYYSVAAVYESGQGTPTKPLIVSGFSMETIDEGSPLSTLASETWFWGMLGMIGLALLVVGLFARRRH
jgi:C1A family cysteine protease